MISLHYDTGPPSSSTSMNNNDDLSGPIQGLINFNLDQVRPAKSSSSKSRQSKRSFNFPKTLMTFVFFIGFLVPVCSAGRISNAPNFKLDPSVLATFSDTFDNKDVELQKMVSRFVYPPIHSHHLDNGSPNKQTLYWCR